MHSPAVVRAVEKLLQDGKLSQRAVAQHLQVSRGTVAAIARGEILARPAPLDVDAPLESGPLERCPTCGGKVYLPCRLCEVRALEQRRRDDRRRRADIAAAIKLRKLRPDTIHPEADPHGSRHRPGERSW